MGLELGHVSAAGCRGGYMAGRPATKGMDQQFLLDPQVIGNTYRTTVKRVWSQFPEPLPGLQIAGLLSGEWMDMAPTGSLCILPPGPWWVSGQAELTPAGLELVTGPLQVPQTRPRSVGLISGT